jgi:hypothetical protein
MTAIIISKKNSIKSIILIGSSKKFLSIFKSIYPLAKIKIYPWRKIVAKHENIVEQHPDLIIVCGFDYKSYWYTYENFCRKNIDLPLLFIKKIANKKSKVIYIDTASSNKKLTFSRYEYAKKRLGYLLAKEIQKLKIISLPTIINKNIEIHGGYFTKLIFTFLARGGYIKTINSEDIKHEIMVSINSSQKINPIFLKSKFLIMPRSMFIDRCLRLIDV